MKYRLQASARAETVSLRNKIMSLNTVGNQDNLDVALERRIDETRHLVHQVDVVYSILSLSTLFLGGLLLAVLADHWLFRDGLGVSLRIAAFFGLLGLLALFAYRRIVPLFLYPINPVYAAKLLEHGEPSTQNAIVNWILLRRERLERGAAGKGAVHPLAERVFDGVTRTAAFNVAAVPVERAVDRRALFRRGALLLCLVLFFPVYSFFSPKNPLTSLARIVMPLGAIDAPQAVRFHDIQPGNTVALQGSRLTVSAELSGRNVGKRNDESVYLFFSGDDGQAVRQAVPMTLRDGRHKTSFPPGKQGFVCGVDYWIQQGDSRSGTFRIDVRPTASLEIASIAFDYPDYTGLPDETVEHGGDIRAVEGTEVRIAVRSTLPLERVEMLFDDDPASPISMRLNNKGTEASATLTLALDPDRSTPTTVRTFTFRAVDRDGFASRRSGVFRLEIVPDRPPIVQWSDADPALKDVAQLDLPLNASLELPVQAEDLDFALRFLRLHVESGNKQIRPVELLDSAPSGPTEHVGTIERRAVFSPLAARLNEGDVAEIRVEAVDTKLPEPNIATTRRISLHIVAPRQRDADESPQNGEPDRQQRPPQDDRQETRNRNSDQGERTDGKDESERSRNDSAEQGGEKENGEGGEAGRDGLEPTGQPEQGNLQSEDRQDRDSGETDGERQHDRESRSGQQENASEKPIDPETNSGDAMERILEQMQKDGKFDPPQNDRPQDGPQPDEQQEQDGNKEQSGDGTAGSEPSGPSGKQNDTERQDNGQQGGEQQGGGQPGSEQQGGGQHDGGQPGSEQQGGGQQDGGQPGSEQQGGEQQGGGQQGSEQQGGEQQGGGQQGSEQQGGDRNTEEQGGPSGSGGGKDRSPGKESGDSGSGGDQKGDPNSEPSKRTADNRNDKADDVPVDPGDKSPRERDESLDPNSPDRRSQGTHDDNPKQRDDVDMPDSSVSGDGEGKGRETTESGRASRSQSADRGTRGDTGNQGVEQQGGAKSDGDSEKQSDSDASASEPGRGADRNRDGNRMEGPDSGEGGQPDESDKRDDSDKPGSAREKTSAGESSEPGRSPSDSASPRPDGSGGSGGSDATGVPGGGGPGQSVGDSVSGKDEANREYSEKVTNLVLEYLEEQLQDKPNPELLKKLRWTEEELRAFHAKWKEMSEKARKATPGDSDDAAWKEALKSFGLKPSRERQTLRQARTGSDDSSATESRRYAPPPRLKDRVRRYTEGIGAGEKKH